MKLITRILAPLVALAAAAALAPAALATTSGSMALVQTAGTSAGGFHDLGLNLSFTNSGNDSPQSLTLNLPPGLLSNAAMDNGQCLKQNLIGNAACEIGTGTVNAEPVLLPTILGVTFPASIPISVSYYLVPPPNSGDLAGLAVYGLGEQIGSTGDISIRPTGNPLGVGATISLGLPDTVPTSGLPAPFNNPVVAALVGSAVHISITSIDNTFKSLRYPATCPSTRQNVTGSVVGHANGDTASALSAPLTVTGCSSLNYSPAFSVTAKKDASDKAVALTTNVTQGAGEAPSQSVKLAFPTSVLGPNTNALGNLCLKSSTSDCTPVGSATAASPLYPSALTGDAYLTGNSSGLTLTLVFPAPFPLTLVGTVNLLNNTASFSGLPDIPLTNLSVSLNGGPKGLFNTDCQTPSGTASATLTDQNGDRTRTLPAQFTVSGCSSTSGPGGGPGSGGGPGGSGSSGGGSGSGSGSGSSSSAGGTHLVATSVAGLAGGKPSLRFRVTVDNHRPKLARLTVTLPKGLSVRHHERHGKLRISGVTLKGAHARSLRLAHGHLVVTLRRATRRVTVILGPRALKESHALRVRAAHKKLKHLTLRVAARNTNGRTRTLSVTVRKFHL